MRSPGQSRAALWTSFALIACAGCAGSVVAPPVAPPPAKTADLAPTFTRVAQELHSQYVVGFTPSQLDGKVHKLVVRVKQAGMTGRARRSYLADPDKYQTQ